MATLNSSATKQSLPDTLAWLWPYWKPLRWRLLFLLLATPLTVGLDVWTPMLMKQIFDGLQGPGLTLERLGHDVLLLLGVGLGHFIFYSIVQSTRGLTNFHFENVFRLRLSQVILQLGLGFFQRFRTGDVTTRLIDDVSEKKLGWFACSGIFRLYEALLVLGGCIFCMLQLHPLLTLITVGPLACISLFYIHFSRRTQGYSQQSQQAISEINSYLTSTLDGIRVLKAYNQQERAVAAFEAVVENQYQKDMALVKVSSLLELSYSRFAELGVLTIFLLGGWLVIQGQLSLSALIAFNFYIFRLIWPMVDIGQFFIKGRQASVSVSRVQELEDYPQEIAQAAEPWPWPQGPLEIAFEQVSYAFGQSQALDQVSFSVASGQCLALAGAIGSGKSLLLDFVPRMLEPQSGRIRLNGQALVAYDLKQLRRQIGFVSQTPSLFSASIRENILFGRADISEQALQTAIRVAQLEQDLPLFSQGLDTLIGQRGVKLSGGQKQRIAIARALLARPPILILDDCTSALDAETEARFWQALKDFVPEMLVLLVTHRARTLQQADQIVLLQQGRVLARGRHEQLSQLEAYQQLYLSQEPA